MSLDDQVLHSWEGIQLAPGDVWERAVEVPRLAEGSFLSGYLYREDDTARPYREVTLWGSDG